MFFFDFCYIIIILFSYLFKLVKKTFFVPTSKKILKLCQNIKYFFLFHYLIIFTK